ncbi:hypothetical protein DPSP01_013130 [Paraphaeosphaeria sporulosa]
MAENKITFFDPECALCRKHLDPEDGTPFLAVSSCNPNPACAKWKELDGLRFLCLNRTTASSASKKFGELPGIYLIHPYCNDIIATAKRKRSLFDCFRALHPVLHKEAPAAERTWPWSSSCIVYGPILRSILSGTDATDISFLKIRLEVFRNIREKVPADLVEMILDQLPFELSLALDYLSGGSRYLVRLRHDPVARRFERAFGILGHKLRNSECPNSSEIQLESEMTAQFFELGGTWYLQDLYAGLPKEIACHGPVKSFLFKHDHSRKPYVAIQVDDFGITHIAFDTKAQLPKWISPNKVYKQAACFQDRGNQASFENVVAISDGLKLCAVDLPQQIKHSRTRAVLPLEVSAFHWSLSPCDLLYVRPTILDVTKTCGAYVWESPIPGSPGFRLANSPLPGFRMLQFGSECLPNLGRTVELISIPPSPETYIHFCESNIEAPLNTLRQPVSNVVGVWQFGLSCNVIVGDAAVLSST